MDTRKALRYIGPVIIVAALATYSYSYSLLHLSSSGPHWNPEFTGQVQSQRINQYGHTVYNLINGATGIFIETIGCSFPIGQTVRIQTRTDGQAIRFSPNQTVPAGCSMWTGSVSL